MARTVATTVIAAFNAQTTTQAFYALLEITHPSWAGPVRLVNNTEDVVSNALTFTAFPFSVVLPTDDEGSAPRLRVSVANTTRIIVAEMRAVAGSRTRVTASLSIVSTIDADTAIADFPDFDLVNVSYNADVMTFDLVVDPFMTEAFPALSFAPSLTPGIF
jgi:hypothetical protein